MPEKDKIEKPDRPESAAEPKGESAAAEAVQSAPDRGAPREEATKEPEAPDLEDDREAGFEGIAEGGPFPIIGIGASAGGLEALETFFSALPAESGLAFVVITHTAPEHESLLPEILRRKSKTSIKLIEDGMRVEENTIYLPPSSRDPIIKEGGVFRLNKRPSKAEVHMPVDLFFKSLAAERGERAGCVILSGTGSDGTQGLRLIKEKSGLAVVQIQDSARHPGMPGSALDTGMVDYVLPPSEMPGRLIEYFKHPALLRYKPGHREREEPDTLRGILAFLANRTRHDFSLYKESTMVRRIERRMTVTRSQSASEYLSFLHRNADEARALFQDLLIGVTGFFRDPEAFSFLKEKVLPDLITRTEERESFRVWVPGCATGEEAFSITILPKECLEEKNTRRDVQIFASDIDAKAIEKARQGVYIKNIAADVEWRDANHLDG